MQIKFYFNEPASISYQILIPLLYYPARDWVTITASILFDFHLQTCQVFDFMPDTFTQVTSLVAQKTVMPLFEITAVEVWGAVHSH